MEDSTITLSSQTDSLQTHLLIKLSERYGGFYNNTV